MRIAIAMFLLATLGVVAAASAAATLTTAIVENGAPISVDECTAVLQKDSLAERVDFTNVSQLTATEVRFAFEIVDTIGRIKQIVSGDVVGSFAPAQPVHRGDVQQKIDTLPSGAKILCTVQMVRFGDGSVWHEGDGPAGSAPVFTPLPGPTPTTQWQWPYDEPTP